MKKPAHFYVGFFVFAHKYFLAIGSLDDEVFVVLRSVSCRKFNAIKDLKSKNFLGLAFLKTIVIIPI